jgi:hypothetical protein
MRTVKNLVSDIDNKIRLYEDKFKELKSAFQERTVLQTGITVLRILDNVENIGGNSHAMFRAYWHN